MCKTSDTAHYDRADSIQMCGYVLLCWVNLEVDSSIYSEVVVSLQHHPSGAGAEGQHLASLLAVTTFFAAVRLQFKLGDKLRPPTVF